jgi:hypothetical protein
MRCFDEMCAYGGEVAWAGSPPQLMAANLESGFSIDLAVVFVVQVDDRFARIMIHRQSVKVPVYGIY